MSIRSRLLPPERGILDVALETESGSGLFFVGLALGRVVRGEMKLNDTGERCFRRLAAHSRAQRPDGAIHVVCVEHFGRARRELLDALASANDGDMVFFVCVDGTIYDALFTQLRISMREGLLSTH
jgi:hypothetical protein